MTKKKRLPPSDSLAAAMLQTASLVNAVIQGRSLLPEFLRQEKTAELFAANRGKIRDMAWGTVRDYGRGAWILAKRLRKTLPLDVQSVLLVALHELEHKPEQSYMLVDQAVEAVKYHSENLSRLANAVLRSCLRDNDFAEADGDDVAHYRHPLWWIDMLRHDYPQCWEEILLHSNTHPPMALRVNSRNSTAEEVTQALGSAHIPWQRLENGALYLPQPVAVDILPGYAEGKVSVQDAGAQWAAQFLGLQDGQTVLDACSAPGSKGAQILELAEVELTAVEKNRERCQTIQGTFRRLGLNARIVRADASCIGTWWQGKPFDRILADVPCSASGVVRRHPDIKWLRREADIQAFSQQQMTIIDALWQTLAPNGKMLYVTCSLFAKENTDQLISFCNRHPDAKQLELPCSQILPQIQHDGFFYALLTKSS